MKNQNDIGRKEEKEAAIFLKEHKYWAFVVPKGPNGQPFDVITARKNNTLFLDIKHLESNKASFPFSRIEPNQITSMNYANIVAKISDEKIGFMIKWERVPDKYFFFSWKKYIECKRKDEKSIKISELVNIEEIL